MVEEVKTTIVEGSGVNTNDETCVKQYFKYYSKLVN